MLEEERVAQSGEAGISAGVALGLRQGHELGSRTGFERGAEVAFYCGCAKALLGLHESEPDALPMPDRAITSLRSLIEVTEGAPRWNRPDDEFTQALQLAQARFRTATAMLGMPDLRFDPRERTNEQSMNF
ncbi:unnamed protein product [Phaeothamnion confervicola]